MLVVASGGVVIGDGGARSTQISSCSSITLASRRSSSTTTVFDGDSERCFIGDDLLLLPLLSCFRSISDIPSRRIVGEMIVVRI